MPVCDKSSYSEFPKGATIDYSLSYFTFLKYMIGKVKNRVVIVYIYKFVYSYIMEERTPLKPSFFYPRVSGKSGKTASSRIFK